VTAPPPSLGDLVRYHNPDRPPMPGGVWDVRANADSIVLRGPLVPGGNVQCCLVGDVGHDPGWYDPTDTED
jgi:hypothetical protein